MKGLTILLVVVIVTVDTVRSQGAMPPTKTKKGPPPSRRRNDNTDIGMPSGKDVPDGTRFNTLSGGPTPAAPVPAAAAPPPAGPPPAGPPAIPAGPPPAFAAPPPAAPAPITYGRIPPTKTKSRVGGRRGDNTDIGMPSGKDVPDGTRFNTLSGGPPPAAGVAPPPAGAAVPPPAGAAAPPPVGTAPLVNVMPPMGAAAPPPARAVPAPGAMPPTRTRTVKGRPNRRLNDNPDFGLPSGADWPDNRRFVPQTKPAAPKPFFPSPFFAPMFPAMPPAVPVAPVAPAAAPSCQYCPTTWDPVCSIYGDTFDNRCQLDCRGYDEACIGQCPCDGGAGPVYNTFNAAPSCDSCETQGYDPVCAPNGDQYNNECSALCKGVDIACHSDKCPCEG